MIALVVMLALSGGPNRENVPDVKVGTPCKASTQCSLRQVCEYGKCQAGCESHKDCPGMEVCAPLRDCRPGDAKCPRFCYELKTDKL